MGLVLNAWLGFASEATRSTPPALGHYPIERRGSPGIECGRQSAFQGIRPATVPPAPAVG